MRRAVVRPDGQFVDCRFRAADQDFDAAVRTVAYPAAEFQPLRFGADLPAEADTLDTPVYRQATGQQVHSVVPGAGAIAVRTACISCSGVGGQPGTATSTGMTLATRPQEA